MKKITALSAVALAVLTAGAAATPSFARDYQGYGDGRGYYDSCRSTQHSNGVAGTVVGGVAGALLGSSLAGRHGGRAGGAAIGGIAGALLGNSIGRSSAKSSDACDGRDYGRVTYRRTQPYYGGGYAQSYDQRAYDQRAYDERGYDGRQDRGDSYREARHHYDPYSY
jgi:uncharacterized protein YcfJ